MKIALERRNVLRAFAKAECVNLENVIAIHDDHIAEHGGLPGVNNMA
jgi:hypothetical protein